MAQDRRGKRLRASGLSPAGQMDTASGHTRSESHRKASEHALGAAVKLTAISVALMALCWQRYKLLDITIP